MARQNIDSSDTPNSGRDKLNDNFVDLYAGAGSTNAVQTTRQINTAAPITGGGSLAADRTIGMANSGVVAGTYEAATFTVSSKGIITAAESGTGGGGGIGPHTIGSHIDFDQDADPDTGDVVLWDAGWMQISKAEDFEDTTFSELTLDPAYTYWARTNAQSFRGTYSWRAPDDSAISTSTRFYYEPTGLTRAYSVSFRYKIMQNPGQFGSLFVVAGATAPLLELDTSGGSIDTGGWAEFEGTFELYSNIPTIDLWFTWGNDGAGGASVYVDEVDVTFEEYMPGWTAGTVADYESPIRTLAAPDPPGAEAGEQWVKSSPAPVELRARAGSSKYKSKLSEYAQIGEFSFADDSTPGATLNSTVYRARQFVPLTSDLSVSGVLLRSVIGGDDSVSGWGKVSLRTNNGATLLASKRFFMDLTLGEYNPKYVFFDNPVPLAQGVTYELGYGATGNFDRVPFSDTAGSSTADFTAADSIIATNEDGTTGRAVSTTNWPNAAAVFERTLPDAGSGTVDAYTFTTGSFVQPAAGGTVTVLVEESGWMGLGQYIFLEVGGYYTINAVNSPTSIIIQNPNYSTNAAIGSTITSGKRISPGGLPGSPATYRNLTTLISDVINNNATANTLADVTGLSFPVVSGETYRFEFKIPFNAAATTTGSRWTLNGPSTTLLAYTVRYTSSTTSETIQSQNAYNAGTVSASSGATAGNFCEIEGVLTASASGTLIARFSSEVAGSAITAKAGATVEWWSTLTGTGSSGVITDHGALTGLTDDDHTQYALSDGTRLKVVRSTTAPSSPAAGQLWADTNTSPPTMKVYSGTAFEAILDAGIFPAPVTISTTTTADVDKRTYLVNCASAPVTLNLPTASGRAGKDYVIKKTDTSPNALTIDAFSTETIDGNLVIDTATPGDSVIIQSDGSNWRIITSPTGVTGIESRTSDPGSPIEGQQWIRSDLTPPQLKYYTAGTSYKLIFTT